MEWKFRLVKLATQLKEFRMMPKINVELLNLYIYQN